MRLVARVSVFRHPVTFKGLQRGLLKKYNTRQQDLAEQCLVECSGVSLVSGSLGVGTRQYNSYLRRLATEGKLLKQCPPKI